MICPDCGATMTLKAAAIKVCQVCANQNDLKEALRDFERYLPAVREGRINLRLVAPGGAFRFYEAHYYHIRLFKNPSRSLCGETIGSRIRTMRNDETLEQAMKLSCPKCLAVLKGMLAREPQPQ